ncbi:outer membrane protein assembly factor BamB family protein [Actinophytocola sediminis]
MWPKSIVSRRATRRSLLTIAAGATLVVAGLIPAVPAVANSPQHNGSGCAKASTWSEPNADIAGTRHVRSPINSRTVDALRPQWKVPLVSPPERWPGTHAATPVVADGVVYTQDLDSNVYAIDLRTGRELWRTMLSSYSNGPNGVAVDDGLVFGATKTEAFALDADNGRVVWRKSLIRNQNEAIDMAPGIHDGTVYISTVPSFLEGSTAAGGVGALWAMDTRTGKKKWVWHTVPTGLWGHPEINGGGGLWYPPTFDDEGYLYVAVANPTPFIGTPEFPWASSRPGPNLYTNSIVKLDADNGRVVWYNQELPHDVYDWDLQNSPILTTVRGRDVVVASGKTGFVYMYDRHSGKRLWKTPVGKHNGRDDDNLTAMAGDLSKMPTMPVEIFPGVLGGVPAPGAVDGRNVYVGVNNFGAIWTSQTPPPIFGDFSEGTGEVVALDLVTGRIKWSTPVDFTPYGAATVTNDLVFTTTFDGVVHAFNTRNGKPEWQAKLAGSTNSPLAIHGDWLITAAGWPQNADEKAEIVAYRLDRGRVNQADLAHRPCR